MNYFRQKSDLVDFKPELSTLSHIFGYMMEALVDLGEIDLARKGLQFAAAIQKADGAIPAYPGVDWVCSTGVAQLLQLGTSSVKRPGQTWRCGI